MTNGDKVVIQINGVFAIAEYVKPFDRFTSIINIYGVYQNIDNRLISKLESIND